MTDQFHIFLLAVMALCLNMYTYMWCYVRSFSKNVLQHFIQDLDLDCNLDLCLSQSSLQDLQEDGPHSRLTTGRTIHRNWNSFYSGNMPLFP